MDTTARRRFARTVCIHFNLFANKNEKESQFTKKKQSRRKFASGFCLYNCCKQCLQCEQRVKRKSWILKNQNAAFSLAEKGRLELPRRLPDLRP